jgi:hypothetical protein
LATRQRTVILLLDETIVTETPPLYSCYGRIGEQVRVPITGNRAKRILHGALNVWSGEVLLLITAHQLLFGERTLQSFGTDKGYYSAANRKYLRALPSLEEFCLQQPGLDSGSLLESDAAAYARLVDRRAGIEPLIGYAKQGGQLGKSRMKQDETTLAAGYASIGGFNLRQLIRHLLGKDIKAMA